MSIVVAVLVIVILLFGFVVLFGAPYLPTLRPQITTALDLLDLKPGQTMLEIGSGDGRVLLAAAERGWKVVGYELNPILVVISWVITRKYRKQVKVIWGNAWTKRWPEAEGVYFFGLQKLMPKMNTKIVQSQQKNTRLVSFSFHLPNKKPKAVKKGVYLYEYAPKA